MDIGRELVVFDMWFLFWDLIKMNKRFVGSIYIFDLLGDFCVF